MFCLFGLFFVVVFGCVLGIVAWRFFGGVFLFCFVFLCGVCWISLDGWMDGWMERLIRERKKTYLINGNIHEMN